MTAVAERERVAPGRGTDRRGYIAAAWAAGYGTMALVWTVTGHGYPFGRNDPGGEVSLLHPLPPGVGAPLFAAVLLAAAVAALATAGRQSAGRAVRAVVLGYGWAVAVALLIVVPDARLLTLAGYAPMLVLGAPFGWPPVDYSTVFTWPLANRALCFLGGLLLVRALLAWQFRTAGGCAACGRRDGSGAWTTAASAARWGRWAVGVAAVIPLLYAVTRFAWLAGIPLGMSRANLDDLRHSGAVWAGAGLGAFAVVGALLTLGLARRWGETFPRWTPGLGGRRVPVGLAVVPAALVALLVTSASLALLVAPGFRDLLTGGGDWAGTAPILLWPAWGPALGAAALAYHLRRRGACRRCGRGD
ncbi:hypothetical protein [Rhizomonospora bruguierae]|uniref:hypothetical protein n=1 Tax=Rhizomonospora bruguierae TaxID=1581705 RepID=UPI001BCE7E04|nr:hypothetical protein [Micromonospora sp. NBRC 107566]